MRTRHPRAFGRSPFAFYLLPFAFCLLLSACDMAATVAAPTPTPPPPLLTETLTFTSGGDPSGGVGRLPLPIAEPGTYRLTLAQANQPGGRWMVWDYLGLHQGDAPIWAIGELEAPPDYGPAAFDEFCKPADGATCTGEFTVGVTRANQLANDLNDGERPRLTITFTIGERPTAPELVLSTLYATHDTVPDFTLRVELVRLR